MSEASLMSSVKEYLSHAEEWLHWLRESEVPAKIWSKIPRWLLVATPALYAYYKYCTWNFGIFKKMGIKGPKPIPILGTSHIVMKKGFTIGDLEMRKYGTLVGLFQGRDPLLLVYDVDMLKQIMVKEFASFPNRCFPELTEYAGRRLLILLKGDQWKHVRNIVTPTFSSGKLRKMNKKIIECTQTLLSNLEEKANKGETVDMRDLCNAYAMDVIASTAFGVKIDSQNDPNNKFVAMGKKAFEAEFTSLNVILIFFLPFLARPLQKLGLLTLFSKEATQFFSKVIDSTVEARKSDPKHEVDFLQLMMDAHAEGADESEDGTDSSKSNPSNQTSDYKSEPWSDREKGLSHEDLLAQGFLFFLAGFETTANTLSLLAYNLATNPECQEKLLKEIDDVMKDRDQIDYDIVSQMPYLEMCINETLRHYPPGPRTDRVAVNDITINGVFIPKGMIIGIPIYALHMDPEVWPEPQKFRPERFSSEEKEARNPYYFMPFGAGPRNCVGMRLAMTEMKIATVTILRKMKFVTCPETKIPLELDTIRFKALKGVKLGVEKR